MAKLTRAQQAEIAAWQERALRAEAALVEMTAERLEGTGAYQRVVVTKFGLGQRVWRVVPRGTEVYATCPRCLGEGALELVRGGTVPCTGGCRKGRVSTGWRKVHEVADPGTIGSVRTKQDLPLRRDESTDVHYMLDITGVGSGTLHEERNLFATYEEALAECERRNAMIEDS